MRQIRRAHYTESSGDVSTLQSRATHSVQHNVALAAVDLTPRAQHAPLAIGAMVCANGGLCMRSVGVPEKENGLALCGIGRQEHLKGEDTPGEVLRQITLAIQCRAQLAFGGDDESGGDLVFASFFTVLVLHDSSALPHNLFLVM